MRSIAGTPIDGERRILTTEVVKTAEKASVQRMVFHSMSADALVWDWEGSADGGATWKRLWRIDYERRKMPWFGAVRPLAAMRPFVSSIALSDFVEKSDCPLVRSGLRL